MSGFGFYETLRIFVPGVVALIIVNIVLRLVWGAGPFSAPEAGTAADVLGVFDNASTAAGAALVIGLLLYAVDVPSRTRLHREGEGWLPSDRLKQMLEAAGATESPRQRALSLYFILSDAYLPAELHRRVYLFGSLYRVYVDLRVLLALSLVAAPIGLAYRLNGVERDALGDFQWSGVAVIILVSILTVAAGLAETLEYLHRRRRKTRRPSPGATTSREGVLVGIPKLMLIMATGLGAGAALVAVGPLVVQVLGASIAFGAFLLWLALEIGPVTDEDAEESLRARWLRAILPDRRGDASQFTPIQRLAGDLALVVSATAVAGVLGGAIGRSPTDNLAWAVLAVPLSAILGFRKHEQRQLNVYKDQTTWLELHEPEIQQLARTGHLGKGRLTDG